MSIPKKLSILLNSKKGKEKESGKKERNRKKGAGRGGQGRLTETD